MVTVSAAFSKDPVRALKRFHKDAKLYGENWREDVKIRLFLDNVRSQSAIMPWAGFLRFN
jgi:hypothetical protein